MNSLLRRHDPGTPVFLPRMIGVAGGDIVSRGGVVMMRLSNPYEESFRM